MIDNIMSYLDRYPDEIRVLFGEIRKLVFASTPMKVEEKLWARLPSYYVGKRFVRLIPFKDHVNVEAASLFEFKEQLFAYRFTPKNMLQIYLDQPIPYEELTAVFQRTLGIAEGISNQSTPFQKP